MDWIQWRLLFVGHESLEHGLVGAETGERIQQRTATTQNTQIKSHWTSVYPRDRERVCVRACARAQRYAWKDQLEELFVHLSSWNGSITRTPLHIYSLWQSLCVCVSCPAASWNTWDALQRIHHSITDISNWPTIHSSAPVNLLSQKLPSLHSKKAHRSHTLSLILFTAAQFTMFTLTLDQMCLCLRKGINPQIMLIGSPQLCGAF